MYSGEKGLFNENCIPRECKGSLEHSQTSSFIDSKCLGIVGVDVSGPSGLLNLNFSREAFKCFLTHKV